MLVLLSPLDLTCRTLISPSMILTDKDGFNGGSREARQHSPLTRYAVRGDVELPHDVLCERLGFLGGLWGHRRKTKAFMDVFHPSLTRAGVGHVVVTMPCATPAALSTRWVALGPRLSAV